jgi:hypothetical protein
MTYANLNWRSHTSAPACLPATALVAVRSSDGSFFCLGELHECTANGWVRESDGAPVGYAEFWWLPEAELLAELERTRTDDTTARSA